VNRLAGKKQGAKRLKPPVSWINQMSEEQILTNGKEIMIEFTNEITVQRPVEEVFTFTADFENLPKWNYYVLEVAKKSQDPTGKGTEYHQVRKSDEQDFSITEYRPGEVVTVRTLPGSQPAFERQMTFTDLEGATRIVDEWQLDTGRPGLLERLAAGQVKQAVYENLGKLKELLETGSVQLQDGRRVRR
jgi:uncharacterized membrane protein